MIDEMVVGYMDRTMPSSACCQDPPSPSDNCGESGLKTVEEEEEDDEILKMTSGCVRECRICQEEDDEKDMDAPCACNGTLKFAHRKCIQRWCNKKGDITCEICNQVFSPNYTCPLPPLSNADVMTIDVRQAWRPRIELQDHHVLDFAAAERQFLQSQDYSMANNAILTCFRSVAILLMLILLAHQTLTITRDLGILQESFFHYQISVLQLSGFLIPCYVVGRSWYIEQCRRRRHFW